MTAAASLPPSPPKSWAAFSREDVSDAKRGHPDFDLREFAVGRGLEWLDHATPAGGVGLKGLLPFSGRANEALVRVPCTVAGVRLPESVGTQLSLRIDTRRSSPPFSFGHRIKLDELIGVGPLPASCRRRCFASGASQRRSSIIRRVERVGAGDRRALSPDARGPARLSPRLRFAAGLRSGVGCPAGRSRASGTAGWWCTRMCTPVPAARVQEM